MGKKSCQQCNKSFVITDNDFEFYKKIDVPGPTLCPDCRQQRRLSHRTRNFHLRDCDLCGKKTMSMYAPEIKGNKFFCNECFQSDKWDALNYGRDFDFSRPFFEQFNELYKEAPKHISNTIRSENSEYIINAHKCKNCYMLDEVDYGENCFYGYCLQYCRDCVDCIYINKCEIGYELVKCENCYNTFFAFNSHNCTDCTFMANCRGCTDCLFCTNLRNAKEHLFNKPASKDEIKKAREKYFTGKYEDLQKGIQEYQNMLKKMIVPHLIGAKNEISTGNYLVNTKNCLDSYGIDNSENCRFCTDIHFSKDCYDIHIYVSEFSYECLHAGPEGYHQVGAHLCWYGSDIFYCDECHNCQDCLGCASLKKKKHCIFNKQYEKGEYEKLRDKIIAHMKETGEWGEYFPAKYSPHSYDQTYAQEFYPLKKDEAVFRGFNWLDHKEKEFQPDQKVLICEQSGKNFIATKAEQDFYKKYSLPWPRIAPEVRISNKFKQTGHRRLWQRQCTCTQPDHDHPGRCPNEFETTYSPERKELVYCESCYNKEIY
ncbi:zinc-ribbon domain-containing protein [Patescibacteria group bacterium]|nr:zinc-ribbon domain-containing protein [Patescibacteria group bacterium]MBU1673114.1 zinc-ribbon domain-containing protein [Patescibacteria group bacterium]MBU1963792.1 zinc-ribbon domain-containing protein [Patescibacteria group bacterium]